MTTSDLDTSLARPRRPFSVVPVRQVDCSLVARWLDAPTFATPLDIRPPVTKEDVSLGLLPIFDMRGNPVTGVAHILSVLDGTSELVGVGITYGWESVHDLIREFDFALPRLKGSGSFAVIEIMARLGHYCFCHEDAIEIRSRNKGGFDRLFATLGARPAAMVDQIHPDRRTRERKQLYHLLPEWFYASVAARRYNLHRPA